MYTYLPTSLLVSNQWEVLLLPDLDYFEGQIRIKEFDVEEEANITLHVTTDEESIVPFTLSYTIDPFNKTIGVIYAVILLCGLYILIIFEVTIIIIYVILALKFNGTILKEGPRNFSNFSPSNIKCGVGNRLLTRNVLILT